MAQAEQLEWPVARYHFKVFIEGIGQLSFQEVTGLEQEVDVVEYRYGSATNFHMLKLPGLVKHPNLVCKKGVYQGDEELSTLFKELDNSKKFYSDGNTRKGLVLTILLLDGKKQPIMTWMIEQAFPAKYSSPELKSDANEIAIEYMEFTYEHLSIVVNS